jgi:hypothetical protein
VKLVDLDESVFVIICKMGRAGLKDESIEDHGPHFRLDHLEHLSRPID